MILQAGILTSQQISKRPGHPPHSAREIAGTMKPTIIPYLEDHPSGCKYLVAPIYKPQKGHLKGEQPYLGDLLTMVITHLLNGMILQAMIS